MNTHLCVWLLAALFWVVAVLCLHRQYVWQSRFPFATCRSWQVGACRAAIACVALLSHACDCAEVLFGLHVLLETHQHMHLVLLHKRAAATALAAATPAAVPLLVAVEAVDAATTVVANGDVVRLQGGGGGGRIKWILAHAVWIFGFGAIAFVLLAIVINKASEITLYFSACQTLLIQPWLLLGTVRSFDRCNLTLERLVCYTQSLGWQAWMCYAAFLDVRGDTSEVVFACNMVAVWLLCTVWPLAICYKDQLQRAQLLHSMGAFREQQDEINQLFGTTSAGAAASPASLQLFERMNSEFCGHIALCVLETNRLLTLMPRQQHSAFDLECMSFANRFLCENDCLSVSKLMVREFNDANIDVLFTHQSNYANKQQTLLGVRQCMYGFIMDLTWVRFRSVIAAAADLHNVEAVIRNRQDYGDKRAV
jgi:hypothetical protein